MPRLHVLHKYSPPPPLEHYNLELKLICYLIYKGKHTTDICGLCSCHSKVQDIRIIGLPEDSEK